VETRKLVACQGKNSLVTSVGRREDTPLLKEGQRQLTPQKKGFYVAIDTSTGNGGPEPQKEKMTRRSGKRVRCRHNQEGRGIGGGLNSPRKKTHREGHTRSEAYRNLASGRGARPRGRSQGNTGAGGPGRSRKASRARQDKTRSPPTGEDCILQAGAPKAQNAEDAIVG